MDCKVIRNKIGPRTDPWRTPDRTGEPSDSSPSTTDCLQSVAKIGMKPTKNKFRVDNLQSSGCSYGTESKAL